MEQDTCEYCQQALNNTEKLVTVYRKRRDRHFIFERVPARVCAGCGERYFPHRLSVRWITRCDRHRIPKQ